MMIAAYQKTINLSSHALFWHESVLIAHQILLEAVSIQSSEAMHTECILIASNCFGREGLLVQSLDRVLVHCGVSWLVTRGLGGL